MFVFVVYQDCRVFSSGTDQKLGRKRYMTILLSLVGDAEHLHSTLVV